MHENIVSLIDSQSKVRPKDICNAVISLLKREQKIYCHLESENLSKVHDNNLKIIKDLCDFPLLLKLMSVCPLSDLKFEKLFRQIRASLLLDILSLTVTAEILKFQSALALQCFTNEYIYNKTNEEEKYLTLLEETVKKELHNGNNPSPEKILCLASYKPLNEYEWSSLLIVNK